MSAKLVDLKYVGRPDGKPDHGGGRELGEYGRWIKGESKTVTANFADLVCGVFNRGDNDPKPMFTVSKVSADAPKTVPTPTPTKESTPPIKDPIPPKSTKSTKSDAPAAGTKE